MRPAAATLPRLPGGTPRPRRRSPRRGPLVLATATVLAGGIAAARSLRRVEVAGTSMAPTLQPGDRLLLVSRPFGPPRWPPTGSVVAVPDPRDPRRTLVKRVVAVDHASGTLEVRGDDPRSSTDSRTFGPVPVGSVVGRAVYRYAPRAASGPAPWPRGYDPS